MDLITDICIIPLLSALTPKFVLPQTCQILRLVNKTQPQSIMPPGQRMLSVYVIHTINPPELCIERRNLASLSSVLAIGLKGLESLTAYDKCIEDVCLFKKNIYQSSSIAYCHMIGLW